MNRSSFRMRETSPLGDRRYPSPARRRPEVPPAPPRLSLLPAGEEVEHDHRPDDREDPAMPEIACEREWLRRRPVDGPVDQAAHECSNDPQQNGPYDTDGVPPRYQQASDEPHDQAAQGPTQQRRHRHLRTLP